MLFPNIIGLSFERSYLIKGLNLMIPNFAKSADFGKNRGLVKKQFLTEIRGFWPKSAVLEKIADFWGKTKDHLPRKLTPNLMETGCVVNKHM